MGYDENGVQTGHSSVEGKTFDISLPSQGGKTGYGTPHRVAVNAIALSGIGKSVSLSISGISGTQTGNAPSFSSGISPLAQTVQVNNPATYTVTVTSLFGYDRGVTVEFIGVFGPTQVKTGRVPKGGNVSFSFVVVPNLPSPFTVTAVIKGEDGTVQILDADMNVTL